MTQKLPAEYQVIFPDARISESTDSFFVKDETVEMRLIATIPNRSSDTESECLFRVLEYSKER